MILRVLEQVESDLSPGEQLLFGLFANDITGIAEGCDLGPDLATVGRAGAGTRRQDKVRRLFGGGERNRDPQDEHSTPGNGADRYA